MSARPVPDQKWADAAIQGAGRSRCEKSRRGVAVRDGAGNIIVAWNGLPGPFKCDGSEACKTSCSQRCIHAEEQAILLLFASRASKPASLLHVKTKKSATGEWEHVACGPPSCAECAKLMLAADISTVWLFHQDGWKQYTAVEFYRATMRTLGLKED